MAKKRVRAKYRIEVVRPGSSFYSGFFLDFYGSSKTRFEGSGEFKTKRGAMAAAERLAADFRPGLCKVVDCAEDK